MWELDYEESWEPKNWCFWAVMLVKTLESPLDWKEIQPVHPKGDQSWVLTGMTDVEAETPILWPPHAKSWLIGKDPDAGKDWGQEEKGTTEDEMIGWHHWLDGHGFGWTPGVVMDRKPWHTAVHGVVKSRTWMSNWTELNWGQWNRLQSPNINPLISSQLIFDKGAKSTQWRKDGLFNKFCWENWIVTCKKNETGSLSYTTHKN